MAGYHFHKCKCGHEWGHDLDLSDGPEAYKERHLCPSCGTDVRIVSGYPTPEAEAEYAEIQFNNRRLFRHGGGGGVSAIDIVALAHALFD